MADLAELKSAAAAAAKRGLTPTEVVDVYVETAIGVGGDEIVRVLVVVPDAQFDQIDGNHFLSALLNVQQDLRAAGDERVVIISYVTPSELADDGDPEA